VSTATAQPTPESGGLAPDTAVVPTKRAGSRKLPIILGVLAVGLAIVLLRAGRSGDTTFRLATDTDFAGLPDIVVPSAVTA